jgi:hypothetical protein
VRELAGADRGDDRSATGESSTPANRATPCGETSIVVPRPRLARPSRRAVRRRAGRELTGLPGGLCPGRLPGWTEGKRPTTVRRTEVAAPPTAGPGCGHDPRARRHPHPRPRRPGRLRPRPGLHGHEPDVRRGRPRRVDRDDPPRARPRRHLPRHLRRLRRRAQRGAGRGGDRRRRDEVQLATKFSLRGTTAAAWTSTAARRTCGPVPRRACAGSASRRSTSTTSTGSTRGCRSRTPSARWPSWCSREGPVPRPLEASAASIRRAVAVHPIAALQSEWSLWTRDLEARCSGRRASTASASCRSARWAAAS